MSTPDSVCRTSDDWGPDDSSLRRLGQDGHFGKERQVRPPQRNTVHNPSSGPYFVGLPSCTVMSRKRDSPLCVPSFRSSRTPVPREKKKRVLIPITPSWPLSVSSPLPIWHSQSLDVVYNLDLRRHSVGSSVVPSHLEPIPSRIVGRPLVSEETERGIFKDWNVG